IDEPLFWPFEQKTDWNSEANCNYFSMSPRKGISITASETPSDSIPLEHHDRNMDAEEGQGVRLVFSSGSAASKIMKLKQKYKGVPRTNTLPSRLSKATKICEKNVPLDTKYYAVEPENGKVHVNEPVGMVNDRIDEDIAAKEVLIETFTGLAEFDGHKHVDSEFNEDDFSLHASLC
ncbi:uncharacterized protein LOC103936267, partial [Pyrus x bretschneideri]|uniref:uncharacterized protein LOC103936267 n=1 Tax=Pyrus x bretschneideri TaxID=225117 RepID=UPI00202F3685